MRYKDFCKTAFLKGRFVRVLYSFVSLYTKTRLPQRTSEKLWGSKEEKDKSEQRKVDDGMNEGRIKIDHNNLKRLMTKADEKNEMRQMMDL